MKSIWEIISNLFHVQDDIFNDKSIEPYMIVDSFWATYVI